MISLIMPPKDQVTSSHSFPSLFPKMHNQIARVQKMLGDEFGAASNIKNRVNRLSVLSAITSGQQRLKLYNKVLTSLLASKFG